MSLPGAYMPICYWCKHFINKSTKYRNIVFCSAFPEGIPHDIWTSQVDHREAYEGDNSIRFEPIDEESYIEPKNLVEGTGIPSRIWRQVAFDILEEENWKWDSERYLGKDDK